MNNKLLKLIIASIALIGMNTQAEADKNNTPSSPNIVFIIADDMGRQDVALYGSKFHETPNLDQLATEGVTFNNTYVAHPRCVPSRIGFMSGQSPTRTGSSLVHNKKNSLPVEKVTFAEHLQKAGYNTGFIGKWHLGKEGSGWPKQQGFDESILAGSAGAPDSYFFPWGAKSKKGKETFGKAKGEKGEYLTHRMTKEALGFIERNKKAPFLLVLSHYAVHTPIQSLTDDTKYFTNKLNSMGIESVKGGKQYDIKSDGTGISKYKTIQNHPTYAAMVKAVDDSVGQLNAKLKQLGINDNTIIIFTSDHGGLSSRGPKNRELATSNLPYKHGKGWLYDGGIRVPHIVKWPAAIKAGSTSDVQVTGTDHYPAILEMAGLNSSPSDHLDGVSYLKASKGETYTRAPMFWHSPISRPNSTGDRISSAIIDGKWKLIDWYNDGFVELFNLEEDKGETTNLAKQQPEKVKELKKLLNAWLKDANAQYRKPGKKMKWDLKKEIKVKSS
ncbi:sulfatase [Thalassotalea psychrophila]|uniref:Sulfatase n=1 Tax=Thalassotalea psychrophila TaxID=3065647 RepID=A0ABY9TW32_9GAMM|nr:sulfatase [Colwelliaceae bacterium SQ149]